MMTVFFSFTLCMMMFSFYFFIFISFIFLLASFSLIYLLYGVLLLWFEMPTINEKERWRKTTQYINTLFVFNGVSYKTPLFFAPELHQVPSQCVFSLMGLSHYDCYHLKLLNFPLECCRVPVKELIVHLYTYLNSISLLSYNM